MNKFTQKPSNDSITEFNFTNNDDLEKFLGGLLGIGTSWSEAVCALPIVQNELLLDELLINLAFNRYQDDRELLEALWYILLHRMDKDRFDFKFFAKYLIKKELNPISIIIQAEIDEVDQKQIVSIAKKLNIDHRLIDMITPPETPNKKYGLIVNKTLKKPIIISGKIILTNFQLHESITIICNEMKIIENMTCLLCDHHYVYLPNLTKIGGNLSLLCLGSVNLPDLEVIDGNLSTSSSISLNLPKITTINGDLRTSIAFKTLVHVGKTLKINHQFSFNLSFDSLKHIGWCLLANGSYQLSLPKLEHIDGDLMANNSKGLSAPNLKTIGVNLYKIDAINFNIPHTTQIKGNTFS